jgi:hypothetical protein
MSIAEYNTEYHKQHDTGSMEDTQEYTYEQNAMVVVDFMDGVIPNRNLFKV